MKKFICIRKSNSTLVCRKTGTNASFFHPKTQEQTREQDILPSHQPRYIFFNDQKESHPDKTAKAVNKNKVSNPQASPMTSGRHALKTACDVKPDRRDYLKFLMKGSFRMEGTGKPQIDILVPGLDETQPCLAEAAKAHEEQHILNSEQNCMDFKKCVDEKRWSIFGEPTISYDNYVRCYNSHHGGKTKDCIKDEHTAYEKGIAKARQLLTEPRCANEVKAIKANIDLWERIKTTAPNCEKK